MTRWEYCTLTHFRTLKGEIVTISIMGRPDVDYPPKQLIQDWSAATAYLGADGWELVSVVVTMEPGGSVDESMTDMYFKRPLVTIS